MTFTNDELKYIRNLIATSGDMGCKCRVGNMEKLISCSKLKMKIDKALETKCKKQ